MLLGRMIHRALNGQSKEKILLSNDADTTAAVCGQLAGAHYGESGIPDRWLTLGAAGRDLD